MISLILTLALVGLIVYLIETYIPMPDPFRIAIRVIVLVVVVLWLLRLFGIADVPVPSVK